MVCGANEIPIGAKAMRLCVLMKRQIIPQMDIINSVQINKCRAKRENICKNEKENKNQKKRKFIYTHVRLYDSITNYFY